MLFHPIIFMSALSPDIVSHTARSRLKTSEFELWETRGAGLPKTIKHQRLSTVPAN
jgi:hypothetical protein